jgi:hypothetical protein
MVHLLLRNLLSLLKPVSNIIGKLDNIKSSNIEKNLKSQNNSFLTKLIEENNWKNNKDKNNKP